MKNVRLSLLSIACALALLLSSCGLIRPAGTAGGNTPADTSADTDGKSPSVSAAVTDGADVNTDAPDTQTDKVPTEKTVLSFLGCGDNIVYYGNVREAAAVAVSGGRQYNFAPTYSMVADLISSADISFINQETLMAGEGYEFTYYPTFNGPQDMGYDLVELGFDVIGMANNHMLDKGGDGLLSTIKFWKGQPVLEIGGYENKEDYDTLHILEKEGVKIAFLSYTYGTNGISLAAGYDLAIPYLDEQTVKTQVAKARGEADFVIVSVHWGDENSFTPNGEQKKYASIMANAGADVIIGHHPHVIQPVEWIERDGGGQTLCVYSLGNFIGEQAQDYNMVVGMISFDIVSDADGVRAENPVLIPTVYYFDTSFYGNCVYLMENFTEELAASHGIRAYQNTTTLERLRKYVTDTVDAQFLPESFR